MASKTYVVLEESSMSVFNGYMKEAMNDYWKITPFGFITTSEFDKFRKDTTFSFIILTETLFEKDKSQTSYDFLNLLQGKNVNKIAEMPEICAIPLSVSGDEELGYGYKLGAVLSFIQKHAQMISEDPSLTGRRYLRYYNKNVPQVPGRTILVLQEDLSPAVGTVEKIRAIYDHQLEIVDEERIVRAITEKSPGILVLHKVGPPKGTPSGYCFKMLIGTDDSEMYYYNQHLIDRTNPDGLLPADLKRLSRF